MPEVQKKKRLWKELEVEKGDFFRAINFFVWHYTGGYMPMHNAKNFKDTAQKMNPDANCALS